jgi:uncharacterized protein with PQ loop repeat
VSALLLSSALVVANVLGVAMIWPQVARLYRHRTTGGVSPVWVGVGIALNTWWLIYALAQHLVGLMPVSTGGLILYLTIATLLHRLTGGATTARLTLSTLAVGSVPLAGLVAGGWPGAGLAVGLAYGVQFSPAAVAAMGAPDISGISPATWWMALVEAVIWMLYGMASGDLPLIVGGTGGTIMALTILVRLGLGRSLIGRPENAEAVSGPPVRTPPAGAEGSSYARERISRSAGL